MAGTAYPALLRFSVFPATLSAKSPLFKRIFANIASHLECLLAVFESSDYGERDASAHIESVLLQPGTGSR